MRVLVIGAHPDDEILGVGGTISKYVKSGDEVHVCIITNAYEPEWSKEYIENKIIEQEKVDQILKIKERHNLNLPTVKLNTLPHGELNNLITNVIDIVNPDVLYTHFEYDLNLDHDLIFKACLVATRPPNNVRLLCFETLSETEWNVYPFKPNIWVDIKEFIETKIEAFKIYKSEVKEYPHPRSPEGIRILAQKRGLEVCIEYAESFFLIRDMWK